MTSTHPVTVSLRDLGNGIDPSVLTEAFGPDGLGIIIVNGLPDFFSSLRLEVLKSISVLASLPQKELQDLESEESHWLIGWSCGKEKLSNGQLDSHKGSFYVNCAFHAEDNLEGPPAEVCENFEEFRAYTTHNIWPDPLSDEGLNEFKGNVKKLCNFIIDVAELVSKNCDKYIYSKNQRYEKNFLERVVRESHTTKARLLHYFPKPPASVASNNDDDWCGEHLDHSCLTGLTSALFLDESGSSVKPLDKSPDMDSGLYIKNRKGEIVKVNIPSDCLAFQTGSALQEVSGGHLRAVPHYVKGSNTPHIARNTLAVFCQPNLEEKITEKENFARYTESILVANHIS